MTYKQVTSKVARLQAASIKQQYILDHYYENSKAVMKRAETTLQKYDASIEALVLSIDEDQFNRCCGDLCCDYSDYVY